MIPGAFQLPVELVDSADGVDSHSTAHLSEDGIFLEGTFLQGAGISWADLKRVLQHPFAQEKLEEVEE